MYLFKYIGKINCPTHHQTFLTTLLFLGNFNVYASRLEEIHPTGWLYLYSEHHCMSIEIWSTKFCFSTILWDFNNALRNIWTTIPNRWSSMKLLPLAGWVENDSNLYLEVLCISPCTVMCRRANHFSLGWFMVILFKIWEWPSKNWKL